MQKALCISDITDRIDPVSPQCCNSTLYETFRDESDLMVVAVADDAGRVFGLIERHAFNLTMAGEYGRALYGNKPVTTLMDPAPLLVDITTPLRDFTRTTLSERPSELMRGFIATCDGRYAGVGTSLSVLKAISADLHQSLGRQQEMTNDLIRLSSESQRHQTFLNMVIQNIPAMVLVKNASDQKIVLLNSVGEEMLNVTSDIVIGKSSGDFMTAERAALYNTYDQMALQSALTAENVDQTVESATWIGAIPPLIIGNPTSFGTKTYVFAAGHFAHNDWYGGNKLVELIRSLVNGSLAPVAQASPAATMVS